MTIYINADELRDALKENKFKVGDRVVMAHPEKANTDYIKAGSKGRVLALTTDDGNQLDIFVDWDDRVLSLSDANGTNYGCKLGHGWWVHHDGLELEENAKKSKPTHVIVMKYDGTTTTAFEKVNDTIVAKAEARRHPDDFASSSIGFKLAFERLMDEVAKEDENKKKTPKTEKVWNINDIHVGDLVELRDDLLVGNIYGGFHLLSDMNFAGPKAVVGKDEKHFKLENGYWYSCEMVKQVYRKVD